MQLLNTFSRKNTRRTNILRNLINLILSKTFTKPTQFVLRLGLSRLETSRSAEFFTLRTFGLGLLALKSDISVVNLTKLIAENLVDFSIGIGLGSFSQLLRITRPKFFDSSLLLGGILHFLDRSPLGIKLINYCLILLAQEIELRNSLRQIEDTIDVVLSNRLGLNLSCLGILKFSIGLDRIKPGAESGQRRTEILNSTQSRSNVIGRGGVSRRTRSRN